MTLKEQLLEVVIKAEASFFSELEGCSPHLFTITKGLEKGRREMKTYLRISEELIDPQSLFYRYLMDKRCREIFGGQHPLYGEGALKYGEDGIVQINHFNTRVLLAFFEVQLGLGFSGSSFRKHQKAIEDVLAGEQRELETNYYNPFTHQDNVGLHYVLASNQRDGGYPESDWEVFIAYTKKAMESAYQISPQDFGGTREGLERAIEQFTEIVSNPHKRSSHVINMRPIRFWGDILENIFRRTANEKGSIPHPTKGEKMFYIHLTDGLLDMPYKNGAVIIFQSICGDR